MYLGNDFHGGEAEMGILGSWIFLISRNIF